MILNDIPYLNPKKRELWHGGDYNPEQWPEALWAEDMRLMDIARFDVATVGVFSWAALEPQEGKFTFEWLDRVMDMLAERGKHAVLATPSAAMPAWLSRAYPEVIRTGPDGVKRKHGNRVNFCPTSPEYRFRTRNMAFRLAERYGDHPALLMWHVSNEYGGSCHCKLCAEAFRTWLKVKYQDDLDELNQRWWTKFWSHSYSDWCEIEIPGPPYGEEAVFGQLLDWKRFVSDQTISFMKNEMEPLRELTPHVPITTNMMGFYDVIDYPKMAEELDLVSWDSYPNFDGKPLTSRSWQGVAMVHDAYRAMKPGKPFLLIESTPSTSNWYPFMRVKLPGVHQFEALQAIAHGSDGAMYFQWRQSKGSAEMYHGAVVTHAGAEGVRVFEEVAAAGRDLANLGDVAGSTTQAEVALIYDWEVNWVHEIVKMPLRSVFPYVGHCNEWHRPFWEFSIAIDIVDQRRELENYRLVVIPASFMYRPGFAKRVEDYVRQGGTIVVTPLTGHVDSDFLAYEGGAPGPLASVLGLKVHEVDALHTEEEAYVLWNGEKYKAKSVCEIAKTESAEVLGVYDSRFYKGTAAVTRNRFGKGSAYFVSADLEESFVAAFVNQLVDDLGVRSAVPFKLPKGVTAQVRSHRERDFIFILNANSEPCQFEIKGDELYEMEGSSDAVTHLNLKENGVKVLVRMKEPVVSAGRLEG